ncbi:GNAT family N-acetyltransferase [Acidianus sulfidivorans JP7]|uniref:tRNA(Met) cytidine acetyltransferase n=1 Tax=Acidianus sulfidivorans JP7 TaxID=619593 RepID=A0A2U9IM29_9CREN|nr:GNAT family N-acetyltransferase [Acidianus sulfidivorans]AWR97055.1 GNAT family N-acetyltransferase [Acidianus sulfidivorans JP7]
MKFEDLAEYFKQAKDFYFRHLAIIQGEKYLENTVNLIRIFKQINSNPKTAYAFHPWANGSKLRFNKIKNELQLNNITDIDYSSSEKYLGESFDLTILDCIDDFRPNYISRLVDLTRGGGLVLLYSNSFYSNKLYKNSLTRNGIVKNLFEDRFFRKAKEYRGIILVDDNNIYFKPYSTSEISKRYKTRYDGKIPKSLYEIAASNDQIKLIEEFDFVLEKGKRIFIVIAPRGRGKSAGVGLALAYLTKRLLNKPTNIILTSPSYYSAISIIDFLTKGLSHLNIRYKEKISKEGKIMKISAGDVNIRWTSPDLAKDADGDLIVVDEAASLGLELLSYINSKWEKIVLISTVHGYEGTGKAFLKYINSLKNSQIVKLEYPIRYAKGDPVEKFIYEAFLLDAEPEKYETETGPIELTQEELFANDKLLRQVYGILVSAHYRNSPDDLMFLGDMSFQRIFTLNYNVIAEIVEEGNLSEDETSKILYGKENEGHLIPHRIIKYNRIRSFGLTKGWRIMRIAVIPELQGMGLGSKLLLEIEKIAKNEKLDWIGSSFIADNKVLNFWLKNNYIPVHFSSIKNEGLGGYSIIVMKALNDNIKKYVNALSSLVKDKIILSAHQVYFNVNPEILVKIITSINSTKFVELNKPCISKINAYLNGYIAYNSASDAIHKLALKYFYEIGNFNNNIDIKSLSVLFARTFQGKSWPHISYMLGIRQSEAEPMLRNAVKEMLKLIYGEDSKEDYIDI